MPEGQEEELDRGWICVGRGKGARPGYTGSVNPQIQDLTTEKIRTDYEHKTRRWQHSQCRQETLRILDRQQPGDGWQIDNAVCIATGSFSRDNWTSRQRSMQQFAAFTDIAKHLQSQQAHPIALFAQEPVYTDVDKQFLSSLHMTVLPVSVSVRGLELGKVEEYLTPSTFVFEPFIEMGEKTMRQLFNADARLYIGSCIQNLTHRDQWYDDAIQAFVKSRRRYYLPIFDEDPNIFEGMSIFWKEPIDEDEG